MKRSPTGITVYLIVCLIPLASGAAPNLETGAGHKIETYGPVLPAVAQLGVGAGLSVDIEGNYSYSVGNGVLSITDISNPITPKVVGKLEDLGTTRQIQVRDDIA